jgi:Phosphotransferase enzyme family
MTDAVLNLDQIDALWLQNLLTHTGYKTSVSAVSAVPIGTGQVGATYRLALTQNGNAPSSLVAKLPSNNELSRAAGKAHMTYIREARFYQNFAAKKALPIPNHLYIGFDEDSHDFTLIMHDLPDYFPGNQLASPATEEIYQAVDAAAIIHAAYWGDPELDTMDWLNNTRAVPPQHDLNALYTIFWPAFCDRFQNIITKEIQKVGDAFLGKIDLWITNRTGPRCLVHNDYRPDNMLFNANSPDHPLVIVDWQTVGVGCGATDIAYYLGTALDPHVRKQTESDLITHYCNRLHANGAPGSEVATDFRDEIWTNYRRSAFAGFMMGVTASMVVEQTERGDAMFFAMCARSATMVLDHAEWAIFS